MFPEDAARSEIDALLKASGWTVQDYKALDLSVPGGVAVREFPLKKGHGEADYLLYVDRKPVGVVEAKPVGATLTGVEVQTEKYGAGLPDHLKPPVRPLPFLYQSTGVETRFTNAMDPDARSRDVFTFYRPETLAALLQLGGPALGGQVATRREGYDRRSLLARLQAMPPLDGTGMRACQIEAIQNLEASLKNDRRRSLLQMQTGSGKTFTAVAQSYRLIKHGGARRVLFLVDRGNLGRQTLAEFQKYVTPDDGRKFTELYNVQFLTSNRIDPVAKVVITTIQRLYSILRGEETMDPARDEESAATYADLVQAPRPVAYNPAVPIETFDFVWTDECHRSIYNLWRGVLEYFDASLIGLTATPSKQTLAFFDQNLVMEYGHAQAVADKVNVDFDVYEIKTKITQQGSTVEKGYKVDRRERKTRKVRWQELDADLTYRPSDLDRAVVAVDQIRTVVATFKERLFTEIFPGRTEVPKTLIFAKDDNHADDIVKIVRDVFGKGNDFCEKITYRTSTARIVDEKTGAVSYANTNLTPEKLLSSFRNAYHPRIAVTVDMIATGTDIKPLEIVFFMRDVQSANYFEQMKGRGCRVVTPTEFNNVTPDAPNKTRYVIVDAVGVTDRERKDSVPLERKPTVPLKAILGAVGAGSTDPEIVSTLAGRLARLDRVISDGARTELERLAGRTLDSMVKELVASVDPDAAQAKAGGEGADPETVAAVAEAMREAAVAPFLKADLRNHVLQCQQDAEQTIDTVSKDAVTFAGASPAATQKAKETVVSFRAYLDEHRDEIAALGLLYSKRQGQAPTLRGLKELAKALERPPRAWTPDALWRAYETLEASRVRGNGGRVATDLISLVRFALEERPVLAPFAEGVADRYAAWIAAQESAGRAFTPPERRWLDAIRDYIAASAAMTMDDLDEGALGQLGGQFAAYDVFGDRLEGLLDELNRVLTA